MKVLENFIPIWRNATFRGDFVAKIPKWCWHAKERGASSRDVLSGRERNTSSACYSRIYAPGAASDTTDRMLAFSSTELQWKWHIKRQFITDTIWRSYCDPTMTSLGSSKTSKFGAADGGPSTSQQPCQTKEIKTLSLVFPKCPDVEAHFVIISRLGSHLLLS